jgi:hypothetical protein
MDEQITIEVPKPHYTLFDAKRDGKPAVVVVNGSLLSFAHIEIFPWHLCITVEAKHLIENGMPAPEESELLFKICNEIESVVLNCRTDFGAENGLFLARSTWCGLRQLLFQIHDPEVVNEALQLLLSRREWEREWDYRMKADEEWIEASYFFKLFPLAKGENA